MKRLVSLGLCISLSLVMVFGTVFSSSGVFADDMGGTMDDGNNMPPPEDAPATKDALTAGGGSDNDDDDDKDNVHDSGESGDDGNDNDKDNEPRSEDALVTTDSLTAKKIECPPGQEYYLFSTSCESAGAGSDSTQGSTRAATACPPASSTPTSYNMPDQLSITNAIWEFNNNDGYDIKRDQLNTQETLLYQAATPINPPVTAKDLQSNPGLRAICTGKPVTVTKPDGSNDIYSPDGTRTNIFVDKKGGYSRVTEYTVKGVTMTLTFTDPKTGEPIHTTIVKDGKRVK